MKTAKHTYLILVVCTLACMVVGGTSNATRDSSGITGTTASTEFPTAGFSHLYEEIPVDIPDTFQGVDYTFPVDLSEVKFLEDHMLGEDQKALLSQNGFVIIPANFREFFQLYESLRYDNRPIFATTDSVYHVYHLLFDKLLRDIETRELSPIIQSMTDALVDAAEDQYMQAKGTSLEGTAYKVLAYFTIPNQLISGSPKPEIPSSVKEIVQEELALIDAHQGFVKSPLFGFKEDYSQYIPRGHYTRSDELKRYFRAMMWFGRINFRLKEPDETRIALLICRLLRDTKVDGIPAILLWQKVYDPTVFFVGKSDDLGVYDYRPLMDEIYGPSPDLMDFADDSLLANFTEAATDIPPPFINSLFYGDLSGNKEEASKGFRFMGQRFVLDAYIFDELTAIEVPDRWLPKGLDVFCAMGNDEAYNILDEMGETEYTNYDSQMSMLRGKIDMLDDETWTQNLYWNWLHGLRSIIEPKHAAYPAFMRTKAWARKDLHTALGSWTELKHDTILYAKQCVAECGADFDFIRGWVEPNPEAFARLLALTRMTCDGLSSYGILPEDAAHDLEFLDEEIVFLLDIAERELNGEEITEAEYWRLSWFGGWLETVTIKAAADDVIYTPIFSEEDQAALVADVATDPGGRVLEEAIGRIYRIFVITPDGLGGLQLTEGGVYSYYEFPWPIDDRLTDGKWREMIKLGIQPDQPEWTKAFIAE